MTTWLEELKTLAQSRGFTLKDILAWNVGGVIYKTMPRKMLDEKFNDGYGGSEGTPFYAYTDKWVIFPVVYDGMEWLAAIPRDPMQGYGPTHHGGE